MNGQGAIVYRIFGTGGTVSTHMFISVKDENLLPNGI